MFETLLKKNKPWNFRATEELCRELADYFDEDKCKYVCEVANELIKRNTAKDTDGARDILICATQKYFNVDDTNVKAGVYYLLGKIYETKLQDYVKAYTAYEKYSLNNTVNDGTHSLLMRALLLRDKFTYSEELEKELRYSYGETDLGLRSDRLYEALASYVTAKHENDDALCEKLKTRIKAIYKADEIFVLDMIMKKDDIRDVLELPEFVKEYIEAL